MVLVHLQDYCRKCLKVPESVLLDASRCDPTTMSTGDEQKKEKNPPQNMLWRATQIDASGWNDGSLEITFYENRFLG